MSVLTWPTAVILLLQLPLTSGKESAGDDFHVSIICFNLDTVEVTWDPAHHVGANLSLAFRYDGKPLRPCPHYFLSAGITSGCIFPAHRGLLEINIRKGEELIYKRRQLTTAYLKPPPPGNMTFLWLEDSVQVTCPDLPYNNLIYEVQYRGARDSTWETFTADTCNVTVGEIDHQRCYDFRARVTTKDSAYGHETHPSDWTHVTHWQAERRTESCQEHPAPAFPKLLVACSLLTLLTSLLLLLSLWRLRRFKNMLMPCVPDPRGSFPGLFEKHGGDFQEWISDTQHVTHMTKPEVCDSTEEALVLDHHGKGEEPEWDKDARFPGLPCEGLQGRDLVSVGGFTFMMDSDAYMTL